MSSLPTATPLWEKLIAPLVHSHFWIGFGAVSCYLVASRLSLFAYHDYLPGAKAFNHNYPGLLLFGTVGLYSFHRLYSLSRLDRDTPTGRWAQVARYRSVMRAALVISILAVAYFAWQLPLSQTYCLAGGMLLGALYVLPILAGKRLRDFGQVKPLLLALGWISLTVVVPLWVGVPFETYTWIIALDRLLYMLAHTLPFDYRDAHRDAAEGVTTWVQRLGPKRAMRLSAFLLLCCCGLEVLYFTLTVGFEIYAVLAALFVTNLITLVMLPTVLGKTPARPLVYGFVFDGLLVLPLLLYAVAIEIVVKIFLYYF